MSKQLNPFTLAATTNIIIATAVIIIGAVFRRSHPAVGYWISVAGLGWYLVMNIPRALKLFSAGFGQLPSRQGVHLLIVLTLLGMVLWSVSTAGPFNYFVIIVLLAIEYLLLEENKSGHEK